MELPMGIPKGRMAIPNRTPHGNLRGRLMDMRMVGPIGIPIPLGRPMGLPMAFRGNSHGALHGNSRVSSQRLSPWHDPWESTWEAPQGFPLGAPCEFTGGMPLGIRMERANAPFFQNFILLQQNIVQVSRPGCLCSGCLSNRRWCPRTRV